jgi:hypothetical protein
MNILVGNDSKSTAAGLAGAATSIGTALTGFLSIVAMQDPKHNWIWAILVAAVTCGVTIYRIVIGISQNYVQSDPAAPTSAPMVVNVATSGPTPVATK